MLGIFLRELAKNSVQPLIDAIPQRGTVVVAVSQMDKLQKEGLAGALHFGITDDSGGIICQEGTGSTPEAAIFGIRRMSRMEFLAHGAQIYMFDPITTVSNEEVYNRAYRRLGENEKELRSFPGDDFVAECIWGCTMEELMTQRWQGAGRHWSTNFCPGIEDFLEALGIGRIYSASIAALIPDNLKAHLLPDQTHHGIVIEGEQVIHFSSCRLKDNTCRIKVDSLDDFLNWKSPHGEGSALAYRDESAGVRLLARNRAIWGVCHAEAWGTYNLLTNNCEHFCRYCRVGEKESRQVYGRTMEVIGEIMKILPSRFVKIIGEILSRTGGTVNKTRNVPSELAKIQYLTTLKH